MEMIFCIFVREYLVVYHTNYSETNKSNTNRKLWTSEQYCSSIISNIKSFTFSHE